jgi:hypothetical protein
LRSTNRNGEPRRGVSSKSDGNRSGNWRLQHADLIGAIRNARLAKRAMATGQPLPPPPPPSLNPDYVQCPYCQRRFNETAAQRHIPFCKVRHRAVHFCFIRPRTSLITFVGKQALHRLPVYCLDFRSNLRTLIAFAVTDFKALRSYWFFSSYSV